MRNCLFELSSKSKFIAMGLSKDSPTTYNGMSNDTLLEELNGMSRFTLGVISI